MNGIISDKAQSLVDILTSSKVLSGGYANPYSDFNNNYYPNEFYLLCGQLNDGRLFSDADSFPNTYALYKVNQQEKTFVPIWEIRHNIEETVASYVLTQSKFHLTDKDTYLRLYCTKYRADGGGATNTSYVYFVLSV